ncbi:MAG: hypothetical protein EAZ13_07160 [Sphingobacteriia bacterium]|nr:MAG: hypothetical protein EAZ13_07160 [Sphingobacteriia bacterium]
MLTASKSISFFLSLGVLLLGCTKKNSFKASSNQSSDDLFVVKNGIIAFENSEAFDKAIKIFKSEGVEKFSERIKLIPNFKGLSEIKLEDKETILRLNKALTKSDLQNKYLGLESNSENDYTPVTEELFYDDYLIQDPFMEILLNDHREVMIQDYVIRITEKGVFSYELKSQSYFEDVFDTQGFDNTLDGRNTNDNLDFSELIEVLPDIYLLNRDEFFFNSAESYKPIPCNENGILGINIFGQLQDCHQSIDNRRRFTATAWAQNLGFYSSIGVKIRRQTRTFGIWWNVKADQLCLKAEGVYKTKYYNDIFTDITFKVNNICESGARSKERILDEHTLQIGIKVGSGKNKPSVKFSKNYSFKKLVSEFSGKDRNNNFFRLIKHN